MKHLVLVLVLSVAAVSMLSVYAGAFTMDQKVVVGDQLIAVARVSAGGLTPDKRIDKVNERLVHILGVECMTPDNVRLVSEEYGEKAIMVGGSLLIRVTLEDARANGTSVDSLARVWFNNAREAMPQARPPCVATPKARAAAAATSTAPKPPAAPLNVTVTAH